MVTHGTTLGFWRRFWARFQFIVQIQLNQVDSKHVGSGTMRPNTTLYVEFHEVCGNSGRQGHTPVESGTMLKPSGEGEKAGKKACPSFLDFSPCLLTLCARIHSVPRLFCNILQHVPLFNCGMQATLSPPDRSLPPHLRE